MSSPENALKPTPVIVPGVSALKKERKIMLLLRDFRDRDQFKVFEGEDIIVPPPVKIVLDLLKVVKHIRSVV